MNILTFDIEEWFVYNKYSHYGNSKEYLPRINLLLNELLNFLEEKDIEATFFCLGDVAYNFPDIIKKIDKKGHHIGCHSYNHRFLGDMTPEEFYSDTTLALDCIENVIGKKVDAYRAPAFSITEKTSWALEILVELGIEIDCSIFPGERRYGGYPSYQKVEPSIIDFKGITIKEFPIPLSKVLGRSIAFSGGGYFRLLPYFLSKQLMKKNNYVMTYFHIRDFDKKLLEKISYTEVNMSPINYLKNFHGIKGAYSKFQLLLNDFKFISLKQAENTIDWSKAPVVKL